MASKKRAVGYVITGCISFILGVVLVVAIGWGGYRDLARRAREVRTAHDRLNDQLAATEAELLQLTKTLRRTEGAIAGLRDDRRKLEDQNRVLRASIDRGDELIEYGAGELENSLRSVAGIGNILETIRKRHEGEVN